MPAHTPSQDLEPGAAGRKPAVRVLFVDHSAKVSGAEKSLLDLLARLDRSRYEPLVACPEGPFAEALRASGVAHEPVRLRRIRRTRALPAIAAGLADVGFSTLSLSRIIAEHQIDIVHANTTTAFLSAGPAAALRRVGAVWHVRDLVDLGRAARGLLALADRVICISRAVERSVRGFAGNSEKVRLVMNGIDRAALRDSARPDRVRLSLGIAPEAPLVTLVGQITPWKGHEFLLDALPGALARFPDLRVLFVGEAMSADDEAHLERLRARVRKLGLERTVLFAGWRDDVASCLVDSTVVVLPSREEPFGRAAVEAMTLGKPVVGTRAGGLTEIITEGETGLLVRYGDAEGLAKAIVDLLGSPDLRAEMGRRAASASARFDSARTAEGVQGVWDEVLAKRVGKR